MTQSVVQDPSGLDRAVTHVPLSDVTEAIDTWDPGSVGPETPFVYIDIASIDRESKAVSTTNRLRAADAPSRARQVVAPGDVLVSTVRPNLNAVARMPQGMEKAVASTGFCVLRADPNRLESAYLYHWVRSPSFVAQMSRRAAGASYPAVTDAIVKDSRLPVPALPEQRRIAALLDKADAIRHKRQQAIRLADDLLRSAFLDMFGDPVTNPKGWRLDGLGRHLVFVTSGSRGWAQHYAATGSRFIRSLDVRMNRIADEDAVFVSVPSGAEARRTQVVGGDVLLTITGSRIGRVAPVPSSLSEAYVSQHVAILRLDGELSPRFVSMFLSLDQGGQRQIAKMQYGQTKPGLNLDQVRSLTIPTPPPTAQAAFERFWLRSEVYGARLSRAQSEVDGLLHCLVQQAFRG